MISAIANIDADALKNEKKIQSTNEKIIKLVVAINNTIPILGAFL